jgi:hypothetical protein
MLARNLLRAIACCGALNFTNGVMAAENIATCSDLRGYANYHHAGLVPKEKSGFQDDKITGSLSTLARLGDNEYDLLFVDVRKTIISTRQSGGIVTLLRKGTREATFLVAYPGSVIELYTFYKDASGTDRYDLLQSKGGDGAPIHKSALMTGTCSILNLNLVQ